MSAEAVATALATGLAAAGCGVLGRRLWLLARASTARAHLGSPAHRSITLSEAGLGAGGPSLGPEGLPSDGLGTAPPPPLAADPAMVNSTGSGRSAPAWFERACEAAAVDGDPGTWFRAWLMAIAGASMTGLVVAGPMAGAVVAVIAVVAVAAALHGIGDRGDDRLEGSLPGLLDAVSAALRSGSSLHQSLGAAVTTVPGRLSVELGMVVSAVDRGSPLTAELDRWALRRPLPGLRLAVAVLALGAEAGGARAKAVDGVADTLRDRLALQGEVQAQSTQARASAAVMTVVPVVVAALAAASDRRTAAFLLRTAPGVGCLVAGQSQAIK